MPEHIAPIMERDMSKNAIVLLYPEPGSSAFSLGTLQSSKESSAVGKLRIPSLCSSLAVKGDLFLSTRKKAIPRGPNVLSVVARTNAASAMLPLEIQVFVPLGR